MTTTFLHLSAVAAHPFAVTATPTAARLRAFALMRSAAPAIAVSSAVRASVVVEVPAIDGNWSRGRKDLGMTSYGKTINAQAAKHGKAVDPLRGAIV